MRVVNLTPYQWGPIATSRNPPQVELAICVRGVFVLEPERSQTAVASIDEAGCIGGDIFAPDDRDRTGALLYPTDLAPFKPAADVLLLGACHTPGGRPLTACTAAFAVGGLRRSFAVIGQRRWQPGVVASRISEPMPFTMMPLTWENAFGGPDDAANPVGKGHGTDPSGDLPTVELPDALIRSRSDRPAPAAPGPVNPEWAARRALLGRNWGTQWRRTRMPWMADDTDWRCFNAAPRAQQLDDYLRGDEPLWLHNLLPDAPDFRSALPARRVRAFVDDRDGNFRAVALALDTLVINLWSGHLILVWRGLTDIAERDYSDVTHVLIADEPQADEPLPEAHYRDLMHQPDEVVVEGELPVPAAPDARPPAPLTVPGEGPDGPATKALNEMGLPPELHPGIDETLKQAGTEWAKQSGMLGSEFGALIAAGLGAGAGAASMPAGSPVVAAGASPSDSLAQLQQQLEAVGEQLKAAGVDPAQIDRITASFSDPSVADAAKAAGADLANAGQKLPDIAPAATPGRNLAGMDLRELPLQDEDFTDCILDGADLSGQQLAGVRFVNASLVGTVLFRAALDGCDFSGANLTAATLAEATATGAVFSRATLARANAHAVVLDDSLLVGANLADADLTAARLARVGAQQVDAPRVLLDNADLTAAKFDEAQLARASLRNVRATDSSFNGAHAAGLVAGGGTVAADFSNASMTRLDAPGSIWIGSTLTGAVLRRADLSDALLPGATLDAADLTACDLRRASLRNASLAGAKLKSANLFGTDMTGCRITGAAFSQSNLYDTVLLGVPLADGNFAGATLDHIIHEQIDR
ncbi:MAG: DUF2169 domain-containing protein [Planctomycetota bacterium]